MSACPHRVRTALSLMYAHGDAVLCRRADGSLVVVPAHRAEGEVLLTREELLAGGVETLLGLVA